MIASGNERGWAAVFLSNLWFNANLVAWLYSGQEERLWRKWRILSRDRCYFSSVQFSCSVVSDSLPSHESQHSKLPCPQLPEFTQTHIHWVSDAIQPSHPPLSPSPPPPHPCQHQSLPMSQLFAWGGQSTGVSASASFPPKKSQGWSQPLKRIHLNEF